MSKIRIRLFISAQMKCFKCFTDFFFIFFFTYMSRKRKLEVEVELPLPFSSQTNKSIIHKVLCCSAALLHILQEIFLKFVLYSVLSMMCPKGQS